MKNETKRTLTLRLHENKLARTAEGELLNHSIGSETIIRTETCSVCRKNITKAEHVHENRL